MKRNVLFVCALPLEIKEIKKNIKRFNFKYINTFFLSTGQWNYNMIFHLTRFLESNPIDFVVNIGVCGYINTSKQYIQVARSYNINTYHEKIIPSPFWLTTPENVACSETIIYNKEFLWSNNFVDMESFGFEFVLEKLNIPRICLKIPFDEVWNNTNSLGKKDLITLLTNFNYYDMLSEVNNYLEKLPPPENNLEHIKNHFKLTHQEHQKLKFFAKKYEAVTKQNFEDFFENNKNKTKKEFLEKLYQI